MVKIVKSIEIEAEPEEVFKILMDFESRPKWDKFTKNAKVISPQRSGPGTQVRYSFPGFMGKSYDEVITEWEENKKITTEVPGGDWKGNQKLWLEKTPKGTQLNCEMNFEVPDSDKIKNNLQDSSTIDQNLMENLKKLKDYIENK